MSFTDIVEAITAVAVIAVTIFEARQLARHPHDPALRVLVPGLALLSFTLTISTPVWPLTVLDDLQDDSGVGNAIWVTMSWCYAAFFLLADRSGDRDRQKRLVLATGIGLVVSVAAHLVVAAARPSDAPRTPGYWASWENYGFTLTSYGYALFLYVLGTMWAVSYLRRIRHRWLRAAVQLVAVGGGAMSVGVDLITMVRSLILYVLFPGVKYPGLSVLYNTGRLGGQLLLAGGLLLAPIAATVYRARQRRDARRQAEFAASLERLWTRLIAEFPFVVLSSEKLERSFDRRTSEIADGLSLLAPYVPIDKRIGGDRSAGGSADMITAAFAARAAARAKGDVEDAWNEGPYPALEPDFGTDWRRRAEWMRQLSSELEAREPKATDAAGAP